MNIALVGYGNMGREVEAAASRRGHDVVAIYDSSRPLPDVSHDFSTIDCIIDFSTASAVRRTIEVALKHQIPIVEGTTGWQEQKAEILNLVRERGGSLVHGNNFSIGAQIFFRIVEAAARLINGFPQYDAGIHEIHHTQKKDAPSGTALTIGKVILSQIERKKSLKHGLSGSPVKSSEIGISSARMGNVVGTHSVLFHSDADEIELTHRAHSRSGFASGAVLAAELIQQFPGTHEFEQLVFKQSVQQSFHKE